MSSKKMCWVCEKETELVYTDVLGLGWCQTCYDEIYWDRPAPAEE